MIYAFKNSTARASLQGNIKSCSTPTFLSSISSLSYLSVYLYDMIGDKWKWLRNKSDEQEETKSGHDRIQLREKRSGTSPEG